jgi:hypothetical protein
METKNNIKYRIDSINQEEFSLNIEGVDLSNMNDLTLKFQYKMETLLKMNEDLILVKPSVRLLYNDCPVLTASVIVSYSVQTLEDAFSIDRDNQQINIKTDILPAFIGAAYSTLRGIVYVRTVDTPLATYPIPMIELQTLINKNAISVEE